MAKWNKSQNYKLRKKIENNKKKQVEDIANGKEPREFKMPETRRSTAADALDSYIARRAAREQIYGSETPKVMGSTRTPGDIMGEAMDRLRDRISMNKNGVGTSPVEARIPTAVPTTNRNSVSMANGAESVPRSFRNSNNGPMTVSRNAQNNPQSRIPRAQNYVGNVDINNRPIVELGNGQYATTETTFQERWKGDEENGHYEIGHFATITKDGRKISDEEMNEYIDRVMSSDNPFETDKKGLNLLYKIDDKLTNGEYIRDNNLEQAFKEADDWDVEMHNLQDSMYKDQREKNNLSSVSRDLVNRVARNADNGVADITKKYAQQSVGPTDTSFLTDNLAAREASLRNAQRENTRLGQLAAEKYDRNRNAGKYTDQYRQDENAQQYIDKARMPEDTGLDFTFGGKEGHIQAPRIIEMFTNPELDQARQIPTQYMTDEEKNIYRFTVGKYGQAEGTAYLKSIESELNRRLDEDLSGTMERASEKYPAFGAYANIAAGLPGGAMGYAALAKNALGNEKIDPNDPALRAVKMREATQRGTQEGIKNQLGIEEDTKAAAISDFLVGAGLSTANSLASAYLLPEPAVLAGFSGNAMADALDKSSTDDNSSQLQSTATAVAQGIAESFFEKFSLENLNAMRSMPVTSVKAFVKNFLKQSFVEGSEEFNTEITNTITDLIINGDNSDIGQIYKSYLEAGADPKSALGASLMAKAKEAGIAFAGGFLSGGLSGTVGSITGTLGNSARISNEASNYTGNEQSYYSELADSIDTSTEEGAQAQAMAQNYADRVSRGERISLAENGYLGNAIDAAISASVERGSTVYESDDIQGTQQQVNDTVNAAVDALKQERNIDTSESTPDEAKNLTEIAVNELNSREMNDYVQKNVHNSVDSPAQNNDSVSVPRENEQENRLRELASDSINSNNVEKELERRATVRFKDDPDARTIYNAYFEDFADQLKNTNISARDMVQMYDENMAKAYEAGRNGRAISTLDEDTDYRMFDRAFPELTSDIWQMGNNKISSTNRELKNSFRDIYGTQGQSAFDTVVRADANFSDDVDTFNRIYNAGRYGKDIKEAGDLSRFGQRRSTEIYESGFKDSADEYDNFSKTVELFKKNPGRAEKGTFINATPRTSKDVRNVMKKFSDSVPFSFVIVDTNDQRSLDSALSQLQKRGLVENQATVESVFKSGSTGAVDTNRAFVVIDINTDNLLNTMGHELTHIAKVYDPEGYRAYSQAVLRKLADTEGYNLEGKIAYMQEQYKAQAGQELSRALAEEEIVAESAAFLNDEDVINELVSKDRTFAEKIRDWLKAVADMIKGLMDNATIRTEAKVLRKDYEAYKNAAELWAKMIDAAADTYSGNAMDAAEPETSIRNQLNSRGNKLSEGQVKYFEDSKKEIPDSISITEWVDDSFRVYSKKEKDFSWATFNDKGEIVEESKPGAFSPGLSDEEKAAAREIILNIKKAPYENAFIRFGELPKSGKSKNYATNKTENGVSVYDAKWDLMKGAYVRAGEALDGAAINYIMRGAPAYLVTGEVNGTGSDGEPLLKNAKILTKLSYDSDKKGYIPETIRYQIGVPSEMFFDEDTGDMRSTQANIYLTNMLQASKDLTPSQNDIKKVVNEITDTYNSKMSKKELTRQISELYTYMRTNEHVDGAQVTDTINAIARQVIREAAFVDPQQQELWDNFRKEMKKTDIYVNPESVRDIDPDGMNALRKRYFGRVNLTSNPEKSGNDGIRTYISLQQLFPDIYTRSVDDITSDADAINEILYGFEKARPKEMSAFGDASTEEEAAADLAQRIMDAYFEVGNESVKTQYQKTYKQLREEMKEDIIREYTDSLRAIEISDSSELSKLRSSYTAGDISADAFIVRKSALEDYRRQQDEAARNLYKTKRDKYVDRIQRNKYKDDIIKTSKQLAKMIITPTDKQHIPTEMVKPISNVLQFIDFSSNRVNPDGSLTKRTVESDEFHKSIDNILNILRKIENNGSVYENNGKTAYLVIDPDLMQNLHELSDSFANNDEVKDNIDNLSTQNLRTVQQTLKALKQMVNNANRFISMERYNTVSELATQSISDFEQSILNRGKLRQGVDKAKRMPALKMFDDIFDSGMLDAYTYFYGLGDTGLELYNNVREGLNRQIRNTDTAIKYMEDTMERNDVSVKDRNKWENDLIEVELNAIPIGGTLPEKTKVKLSAAQIMSLYLLNKRGQARMHLYGNTLSNKPQNGGFVLEPSGKNAIEMDDKHVFKVTEADVDELVSKLTPQQKAVADDIGRFLTEVTSKWGNEVTQKLYGYNKFEAKNYFPIKVDNSTIATTSESLERNGVAMLKNMGQTKTVQQRAYNPLTLQNIFDVYTAQAEDMGNYNAYVAPTADLQMWINYKGKEGNVKRALTNAYGEKASQYFMNLMRDINQPRANTDKWDKLIGSFMGLQRAGAIWGNLRVAVQQPFAYTRAAAVMDPKYLLQGLTLNPAKQDEEWELAKKYAPIAQWKDYGFFDIGVGPSMKRVILGNDTLKDKIADLGMQPASMGDTIAWVRLWYASQAQVKDQHPELKVGSEEFYEEAGKIFSHVVDATQVVDSVLHRSDIMKSKNTAVKGATAFLSEPTKTYNMLFRALYDFVNATGKDKGKKGQALIGTVTVWAISQAVNSAVASLISALRYHDKDKDLKEKYIEKAIPDFIESMKFWNSIPIIRDIISAAFGGETDESSNYELLSTIPKLANELIKVSKGESKKGPWGILYQASQLSTFWGGNNFQNPLRDIDGIIDNLIIGDDMRKYYPYQKAKYNMYATDSKGSYTNLKMFVATAMKAYAKGDTELGDMIVRDLKKKIPEEKIDNIFANALKEEEGIKTLARAFLDGNEQQAAAARSELLSKGYSEEMIDKRLDSAFQEIVGSSEDIATSFVEKSEGWEDQLREFANYKTLQGKDKKEIRSSLKKAVTNAYADDYRAENAAGKKDIKNKLLSLSYDGEKLYTESDFTKKNSTWNKQ